MALMYTCDEEARIAKIDQVTVNSRFGSWTVLSLSTGNRRKCLAECACGYQGVVDKYHLIDGRSTRCNACRKTQPRLDLAGVRVGYLTVTDYVGVKVGERHGKPYHHWACYCDCGNRVEVRGDHLGPYAQKTKLKKSCGCMRSGSNNYGWKGAGKLSGEKWRSICRSANKRNIPMDITIQEAWGVFEAQRGICALTGWELVLDADISLATASLDRIDSSLGYTLDNIQWVHKHANQAKNDLAESDFIAMCKAIARYRTSY